MLSVNNKPRAGTNATVRRLSKPLAGIFDSCSITNAIRLATVVISWLRHLADPPISDDWATNTLHVSSTMISMAAGARFSNDVGVMSGLTVTFKLAELAGNCLS